MNPTPYLIFHGTCREAMTRYAEIFGGEIDMMMSASEMPGMDLPPEKTGWIAHCGVRFSGGQLLGSDDLMDEAGTMAGCSVMMELPTADEARRAFDRLADSGHVHMSFGATFWSTGFGTLTDRFGIRWMISAAEAPPAA